MPIQQFFEEQMRQVTAFMADPKQAVRVVQVDADLKPVLRKMLAGYDAAPTTPHALIPTGAAFTTADRFFAALLADLGKAYEASADELAEVGVIEPFTPTDLTRDPPEQRVVLYLCSMAELLPDHVGSLVVVLDPEAVDDPVGFRKALAWLADKTWSPWVKYLVIDDRANPTTAGLEELSKKVGRQSLHLTPAEMEKRITAAVATDAGLSLTERRQYTGMLGGFALARKDHPAALKAYQDQLALARLEGSPVAVAPVLYSVGNAHLAAGDLVAAEAAFAESLGLALEHKLDALRPLLLTQLAMTLSRAGRAEQAEQSFALARRACRELNSPPTEAYALDCQAQCYVRLKKPAEAERCWKDALAVYQGITSDAMRDVRASGLADIRHKLEHFYKDTRQPDKLAALKAGGMS